MCRKHHRLHDDGKIADLTLQLILYNFYNYGPEPWLVLLLDDLKDKLQDSFGLPLRVESDDGQMVKFIMLGMIRSAEVEMPVGVLEGMPAEMVIEIIHDRLGGSYYDSHEG